MLQKPASKHSTPGSPPVHLSCLNTNLQREDSVVRFFYVLLFLLLSTLRWWNIVENLCLVCEFNYKLYNFLLVVIKNLKELGFMSLIFHSIIQKKGQTFENSLRYYVVITTRIITSCSSIVLLKVWKFQKFFYILTLYHIHYHLLRVNSMNSRYTFCNNSILNFKNN